MKPSNLIPGLSFGAIAIGLFCIKFFGPGLLKGQDVVVGPTYDLIARSLIQASPWFFLGVSIYFFYLHLKKPTTE